jgi:amino acid transporter
VVVGGTSDGGLRRHFGLWQATAVNVTMVVGAGIFVTIPPILKHLPGPAALLPWLAVGALALVDGLVWSELGAALPGSGGSFVYLLECYGPRRWGRLMAFLFIWQFLLSGPLELGSGLIAADSFVQGCSPALADFNKEWTWRWDLWPPPAAVPDQAVQAVNTWSLLAQIQAQQPAAAGPAPYLLGVAASVVPAPEVQHITMTFSPTRLGLAGLGVLLIFLLYRRIENVGRLTLLFGAGVLAAAGWVLVTGAWSFDPARAFNTSGAPPLPPGQFAVGLGAAAVLALYSYLGYYNICYMGDEVRDPGRTIPRAILFSAAFVGLLFVALHLAMLGTVAWQSALGAFQKDSSYNLPAAFMQQVYGSGAAQVLMGLLIVSCLASVFSGMLGYSRIPYGAARTGHFFAALGRVHPTHRIPHVALLLVGGLTLFWSFFDLQPVIDALVSTRLPIQFAAQAVGVMLLRRRQPSLARPFRIPLYPLPCLLALGGWLAVWLATGWVFVLLGLGTLAAGVVAFLVWSRRGHTWPFDAKTAS